MAGFVGLAFGPTSYPIVFVVMIALGQGMCFALGMMLPLDNSKTAGEAHAWTMFVLCVGYTIAALGPLIVAIFVVAVLNASAALANPASPDPLDAQALETVKTRFHHLMDLDNHHDVGAIHNMFWQSTSALLVAKSAVQSEGNWAGFWGNEAIDRKLHDIAVSGPVVLEPDYAKLKVVGLTHEVAESYAPLTITVSYAGQDGTPKPFLLIVDWLKAGQEWRIASEIILPIPPAARLKG